MVENPPMTCSWCLEGVELKTSQGKIICGVVQRARTLKSDNRDSEFKFCHLIGKLNFLTYKVWKQVPTLYIWLSWEGDEIEHEYGAWHKETLKKGKTIG